MATTKKKTATGGRIRVTFTSGWAGTPGRQILTLRGLGLRRSGDVRELPDNPTVRGACNKVAHMITVEQIG